MPESSSIHSQSTLMRPEEQQRLDFQSMLSHVVGRFNEVEFQLTALLIDALEFPKQKQNFAYRVLFNNAIIPFAQKLKLLLNLRAELDWPTFDPASFHRLAHIRNQFAHCLPQEHIEFQIRQGEKQVTAESKIMLESINGQGRLTPTSAREAFEEFKTLDLTVLTHIRTMRQHIQPNEKRLNAGDSSTN